MITRPHAAATESTSLGSIIDHISSLMKFLRCFGFVGQKAFRVLEGCWNFVFGIGLLYSKRGLLFETKFDVISWDETVDLKYEIS